MSPRFLREHTNFVGMLTLVGSLMSVVMSVVERTLGAFTRIVTVTDVTPAEPDHGAEQDHREVGRRGQVEAGAGGGDVTVALTGVQATGSVGTLSPSFTV
jgi:hypothetical protein